MPIPHPLEVMVEDAATAALFLDFDGTLAPIVDDPAAARVHPVAHAALVRLVPLLGTVAVVSGRPAEFLVEWTTYSPRADANAHRRIRALNAEVVKIAGFKDQAFPNYPDNEAVRDYFPNRGEIERMRKLLDPDGLSTSSLLAEPSGIRGDTACR